MKYVRITPAQLHGSIKAPPSKSLCHRAIIGAALSKGTCKIDNVMFSDDILATIEAVKALGTEIECRRDSLIVKGKGVLHPPSYTIDCGESGSTLRFFIPLSLLTGGKVTFTGKGRLKDRPLHPYYKIFEKQKIYYSTREGLPLTVEGTLTPGEYCIDGGISSQFITGLMFALPLLDGDSSIIIESKLESKGYIDLTMDMLKKFNIDIVNNNYKEFYINGNQQYKAVDYRVEGDFSQAAFFLSAGALGGRITCLGLNMESLQGDRFIVDLIKSMGGSIEVNNESIDVKTSSLKGITFDASQYPDMVPVVSVLGALARGKTEIINGARLRLKESDRLKAMACELNKLGADVREVEDGLIINGREILNGGTVDSWNDHRVAMALSVASIRCKSPVTITNSGAVRKSYPDFFNDFSMLGGIIDERSMGE